MQQDNDVKSLLKIHIKLNNQIFIYSSEPFFIWKFFDRYSIFCGMDFFPSKDIKEGQKSF